MFWLVLVLTCITAQLSAADAVIRGVVTDEAGKPVRGATVRAVLGDKGIARFSQKDGRYEITVTPGEYVVTVNAFGFGIKRQKKSTAEAGDLNFQLSRAGWSHLQLSGAEASSFLPENEEGDAIRNRCSACHSLSYPESRRGWTSDDFADWLPRMWQPKLTIDFDNTLHKPEVLSRLVDLLGKYFGPEAPAPTPQTVKHVDVADEALNATFVEYAVDKGELPRIARPFAVGVDNKRGYVWVSNYLTMLRLNMKTEKIDRFPDNNGHCVFLDKDGRVWTGPENHNEIISLDPDTGEMKSYPYQGDFRLLGGQKADTPKAHFLAMDKDGYFWMTSNNTPFLYKLHVNADKMDLQMFPNAPYAGLTPGLNQLPWEKPDPPGTGFNLNSSYDVVIDSKGLIWRDQGYTYEGRLLAFDPKTGKDKAYAPPVNVGARGIAIDPQDNIWFSITYPGTSTTVGTHGIGKFDQRTQQFKIYQTPTRYSLGYGIVYDKDTGYIWWADTNGGNITRFDPITEKFTEFPVPDHGMKGGFISVDDQGRVWFAETWAQKIAVLDPGDKRKAGH
jgi:virginiamycin B lyase